MPARKFPIIPIPLYQGDDRARLAELQQAVDLAERAAREDAASARLGDENLSVDAARRAYTEFVDEVAERTFAVEIQMIGSRRFRDLVLAHPPRLVDGEPDDAGKVEKVAHEDDEQWGVNTATFPKALLSFIDGDYRTMVTPEFATPEQVRGFIDDELSDGELQQIWVAAFLENKGMSLDPKFLPHYSPSPSLEVTST